MNKKVFKSGEIFIWFAGLGLGATIIMISGVLLLILLNSSEYLLPPKLFQIQTKEGEKFLGNLITSESFTKELVDRESKPQKSERYKYKIGNREIYGLDFRWFDKNEIVKSEQPESAYIFERTELGNFFGYVKELRVDGEIRVSGENEISIVLNDYLDTLSRLRKEMTRIEKNVIGDLNYDIESSRLEIKILEYQNRDNLQKVESQIAGLNKKIDDSNNRYHLIENRVDSLREFAGKYNLTVQTANGDERDIPLLNIIRAYQPNRMSFFTQAGFVISKIFEFIFDDPRESNTEGGVFPALFGTVMMVILMSIAVVPFGVIAALYLREYAKQGPLVRIVRIAVNNLAGIPSIVFGIFGLGFFIYFVGGTIDQIFYPEHLPNPTLGTGSILWASLTLALLTMPVVIVSTEEALATIPRGMREASLALGSTKWQTIRRVVLPAATPGILTGVILAMARGAGEVAPLMITGVVKLAPSLPFDWRFPFFHLDRKFMHLGFHIYDVGFQSPNVEAAMPMVYMTTLLLIFLVILLNITAMIIRARLRKKYKSSTF